MNFCYYMLFCSLSGLFSLLATISFDKISDTDVNLGNAIVHIHYTDGTISDSLQPHTLRFCPSSVYACYTNKDHCELVPNGTSSDYHVGLEDKIIKSSWMASLGSLHLAATIFIFVTAIPFIMYCAEEKNRIKAGSFFLYITMVLILIAFGLDLNLFLRVKGEMTGLVGVTTNLGLRFVFNLLSFGFLLPPRIALWCSGERKPKTRKYYVLDILNPQKEQEGSNGPNTAQQDQQEGSNN